MSITRVREKYRLTGITALVRLIARAMGAQLYCATPISTVNFSVVVSAHTRLAVVGSECRPVGTIDKVFLELRRPSTIGKIGSRAEVSDGVVDDLIL